MADTRRTIAIIPARGGSKRLPRKNVLPLAGKPLIAWSIEAAIASGIANAVVVSSDDDEILAVAGGYDVSALKRPAALATDAAATIDVVLDVLAQKASQGDEYSTVILLQPTSPFREGADISAAHAVYLEGAGNSVVSVCEVEHPIQWCGTVTSEGFLAGFDLKSGKRSQDYPTSYRLNGAIYIASSETLRTQRTFFSDDVIAYKMPRDRSVDIDSYLDFIVCEAMSRIRSEV